jgi:DNA-binding transcriptional LysR family regulator
MSFLPELRLSDLVTLLAVHKAGTISGAARQLRVTPSQVSKAVSRLEKHYGLRLLSRGARGVAPTPAARRMLPRIANAVEELRATNGCREDHGPEIELAVAGPSYLVSLVLPAIVHVMPGVRLRGLEFSPGQLRATIAENFFDVALAPGGIHNPPASWTSDEVGEIRHSLFARPDYVRRLGPLPLTVDQVRALPFIAPTAAGGDRFVAIGDDCPLPREERIVAHEAQMVGAALEFARGTDHVVYCPVLAAQRFVDSGDLVEVPVVGWNVLEPIHVLCNGDRVLWRTHTAVVQAVKTVIGARELTCGIDAPPPPAAGRHLGAPLA